MGQVGGDDEDLTGADDVFSAIAEDEAEGSFEDVGNLLVGVGVGGDGAAFFEDDACKHGLLAGDELAGEERVELLEFYGIPGVQGCGGHEDRYLSIVGGRINCFFLDAILCKVSETSFQPTLPPMMSANLTDMSVRHYGHKCFSHTF